MFFPETCELTLYKFSNGLLHYSKTDEGLDLLNSNKDQYTFLARVTNIGITAGISGEAVAATPIGKRPHNAISWLEWFYTGFVADAGFSGSIYYSSQWFGAIFGGGGKAISGGYSSFYYSYIVEPIDLDDESCECTALRFLADSHKEKTLMKSIFGLKHEKLFCDYNWNYYRLSLYL